MLLGIVHWGLGLIAGALLAIEISKSCKARGIKVHFPLLAAAGYLGLMVWHSGLSGSAPLLVNTPGHFLEDQIGQLPLSETIFQPFNVVFLVVVLVGAPLLIMSMHPRGTEVQEIDLDPSDSGASDAPTGGTGPASREGGAGTSVATETRAVTAQRGPAERLMHSRIPVAVLVIAGFVYLIPELVREGLVGLDLNLLNFTFLMVGLALHGTLASYANAAADGARSAAAVIVQFPLYAGIMGIMEHSGLLQVIADWFVAISTSFSFPFFAMLSAALVNLAVPSGGGQWAVQGPVMVEAAQSLGVENGTAVMAVAMGDQLTNGIQPFWALPLLALTRLRAGQVLGYTAVVMLFAFAVAALCITFLS
jgi:short-chain fatty acids transporter